MRLTLQQWQISHSELISSSDQTYDNPKLYNYERL